MPTGNARRALHRRAANPTKRSPPVTSKTRFHFPNLRFPRSPKSRAARPRIVLYFRTPAFTWGQRRRPPNCAPESRRPAGGVGETDMVNSPWRSRLARVDYDGHRGREKTLRRVVGCDKDTFYCWRFISGLVGLSLIRSLVVLRWSCCALPPQSDTVQLRHGGLVRRGALNAALVSQLPFARSGAGRGA